VPGEKKAYRSPDARRSLNSEAGASLKLEARDECGGSECGGSVGSVGIDALIGRMEALLEPLAARGDPRRFFHATYLRTTRAIRDALKAGTFSDPDWVERWDIAFADLYLDALRADSDGEAVPLPWAVAFQAGRQQPSGAALRHVLLGMNAHINYDLPQALLTVISGREFGDPAITAQRRADHQRIDEVLARQVSTEDTELSRLAGPRSLVDTALGPVNQAAVRRFLRESRAKVWDNAMELNEARTLGPAAYAQRLSDLEALSEARVAELVRPGQVLLRLAVHGFGVRLAARPTVPRLPRHRSDMRPNARPTAPRLAVRGSRARVAARLGALLRPGISRPRPASPGGSPGRLRSFDPARVADQEFRAWVSYYQRDWLGVLRSAVGLVRAGFGMSWPRTLRGAWLVLRANQLWAPADNDPDGARRCMRRFYGLVRASYGEPRDIAEAARLEVDWWRVHREHQRGAGSADPLAAAVTRLYGFLYRVPDGEVRPAAVHRADAMDLSDRWVAEGCHADSPLLAQEHAALVRCYAALLAAVHR
jgi:hypothetical protein